MVRIGRYRVGAAALALALVLPGLALAQDRGVASGKIPVTTTSEDALKLYLEGRSLQDVIRGTDARKYYEEAVVRDPNFAMAYLALANTAPSPKEFFENLNKAVALAEHASEGERGMIWALDAGVKGEPKMQKEHLTKLVGGFPSDERVHTALANFHFGRQEYGAAINHYGHAVKINPEFSPPYNSMGYAHRSLGQYEEAEEAFLKYIELIPDQPNPHDSYAELLMKMGRFEESIAAYEKALSLDEHFVFSFVGIANNQIFLGEPEMARETLYKMSVSARNTGERRTALVWTAASYVHEGYTKKAVESVERMSAIAKANGDNVAITGDLILMGNILLEADQPDAAAEKYERAVYAMNQADAPDEVKEATRRNQLYRDARVALRKQDLETAREKTAAYSVQVKTHMIPFEERQVRELLGAIALGEDDFAGAREHLAHANQQNPRILFMMAMAYHGLGDAPHEKMMLEKAGNFNGLNFNYAYVRPKAQKIMKAES